MFHIHLIILLSYDYSHSIDPILLAKPYPFNRSQSSHIECFSNTQGLILSLTILATILDMNLNHSLLQYSQNNISKNGSITLTIPAPFNYSQLESKIECRSTYHHGEQKIAQLDVLSVVEIPQKELFSMNTNIKQLVTINCRAYGTNVFIHWNFHKDISKTVLGPLPIGIRISQIFTMNDTLIIDHVSYSDHHGYYRCSAINKLLDRTYEDHSLIYLNVKKNTIWIPIVIACVTIGICILTLILCSKYCHRKKTTQLFEKKDEERNQIVSNRESLEFTSSYDSQESSKRMAETIEESMIHQKNIHTFLHSENSTKSLTSLSLTENDEQQRSSSTPSFIFRDSPQFVLSNPFLDPNVRLISSINKLK